MNSGEIGVLIKARRKFLKIRQQDLADISGISERTLRDIETGNGNPELESLMKLCEVLGLEIIIQVENGSGSQGGGI